MSTLPHPDPVTARPTLDSSNAPDADARLERPGPPGSSGKREARRAAVLRETRTGRAVLLEPEHVVGRARICTLRLEPGYVSAQHAFLRYAGDHWAIRDLGSTNGTFVDSQRIRAGEEHALHKGAHVAFGDLEADWELADDSAPAAMVVPVEGGPPVLVDGDLLALPSVDEPEATIYRTPRGDWVLERSDGPVAVLNGLQVFSCAGRLWRFSCAENIRATARFAQDALEMTLRQLHLSFAVSRNEEYVELRMSCNNRVVDLGARAHNYLLLTLARRRAADAETGLPPTSCGWVDQETLSTELRTTSAAINVEVFRLRKHFAERGLADAAGIVERRPRELRIGTGRLTITRL